MSSNLSTLLQILLRIVFFVPNDRTIYSTVPNISTGDYTYQINDSCDDTNYCLNDLLVGHSEVGFVALENMINVFHINIQCLSNKIDALNLFLSNNHMDIVCLSEHWQNDVNLNFVNLYNYSLGAFFCRKEREHGGVCIFVKNGLKFRTIDCDNYNVEMISEFCCIEICSLNLIILSVYRSGKCGFDEFLENFESVITEFTERCERIIIVGDFNIDFKSNSNHLNEFNHLIRSFNLNTIINDYTRVTAHSKTCIDNILTDLDPNMFSASTIEPNLSDHRGQVITINEERPRPSPVWLKLVNDRKLNKLRSELLNVNFSRYIFHEDPNVYASNFLNLLSNLSNKHLPIKNITNLKRKPPCSWFSETLRNMRDTLSSLQLICECTSNTEDYIAFNNFRKHYRRSLSEVKREKYNHYIKNSDNISKSSWNVINFELNRQKKPQHIDITATSFSDYFKTVVEEIISSLTNMNIGYNNTDNVSTLPINSFFFSPILENEVFNAINNLKNTNSFDYFGLNTKIIKSINDIITEPLTVLFNMCVSHGVFPDILKIAKVIPLFKKGDASLPGNYRPISIIPILGKIFEVLIKNRLVEYLNAIKFISEEQYGFQKGKSTIDAILSIVESIVDGLEKGDHVEITLFDLSKAFDCVSHDILLSKLEAIGMRGISHKLLSSYLLNRKQSIVVNGKQSKLNNILHGVPQGSVLGPLLFIIFINDFSKNMLPIKSFLFADDTTILSQNKCLKELKRESFENRDKAESWFTANLLKLNTDKTQSITFSSRVSNPEYVKLLGITIDNNLNWIPHIETLLQKLSKNLYVFRQLKKCLNLEVLRMAYFSLFHSHITYGILLWGNSSHAIKIFILQKKLVRIISDVSMREHCKPLFVNLKIMSLPSLFIYYTVLEIHKNRHKFTTPSQLHSYPTRRNEDLYLTRFRLNKSKKCSLNLNLYNHLPTITRNMSFYKFKSKIKDMLLLKCFYSINEYLQSNIEIY